MASQNTTTWERSPASSYPKLTEDIHTDVVIIGGGMAGIVSAYELTKAGKKVVVLEKGGLGSGATRRTTAFITQIIDTDAASLISMMGESDARLAWQSGGAAIAEFREIVTREDIDCSLLSTPVYMYAQTNMQSSGLAVQSEAMQKLGTQAHKRNDDALGFKNTGYVEVPEQAKFHPLKFLDAVAAKSVVAGARIFENTTVTQLSESGQVSVVTEDGHTVHAEDVIVATHVPFNKPKVNRFKKATYRSYVLELSIPQGLMKEGMYSDLATPYTYFRIDPEGDADRMILGGADHREDLPFSAAKNFRVLEHIAKEILGSVHYTINRTWHGRIIESVDGLPFIGAYAPHRYMATAFSGNGMTYSAIAGMMFRDLIVGRENPWKQLYAPARPIPITTLIRKGWSYIEIFLGGIRNAVRGG